MRRMVFSLTLTLLAFLLPFAAVAAMLEVEVSGLASDQGRVHVALYDTPDAFPKSDGMLIKTKVPIQGGVARVVFDDLKPGRYAVAVFHDENGNNSFDQGIFGIPLESYGFSSGARAFFAAPSFEAAAFDVAEPETRIVIRPND
ncbi:MAG: DUF2141 domain-containing protein [Rhodospirillales bacterium]